MMFLSGRLGLATTRIPHADRHGLIWLTRGRLYVEDGVLRFSAAASEDFDEGEYSLPHQAVSMILLDPGTSLTHDVFRLAAAHGTELVAIGDGGVKFYTAPPVGRNRSNVARRQAELWAEPQNRLAIARKMYAVRFGRVLPHKDIAVLRGIEGGRVKEMYAALAAQHEIPWQARHYNRKDPASLDIPNQAINHAATGSRVFGFDPAGTLPRRLYRPAHKPSSPRTPMAGSGGMVSARNGNFFSYDLGRQDRHWRPANPSLGITEDPSG